MKMSQQTSSSHLFECSGLTTEGVKYETISEMWNGELSSASENTWYTKSAAYWQTQEASVEGMLGGLGSLHNRDINASEKFLQRIDIKYGHALDVGAGIGRVTCALLLPHFETVDMLEQNPQYVNESEKYIENKSQKNGGKVGKHLVCGMQEFRADGGDGRPSVRATYDVIWIQWCVIYLTDHDFIAFLKECVKSLKSDGVICLKDNVARKGFLVDKEDSSVMRSDKYMKHLFDEAGLKIIRETRQMDFPKRVFPVWTFALKPK